MFTNRQIWHLYYLILCSLLLIPSWGKDPIDNLKKINEMNLLFPHTQENRESLIQYKLIAYNGCYDWSSTSQSYFQIKGIPDENKPKCHSSAIVSLVNSKPINQAIWIIAKDIGNINLKKIKYSFNL